MLSESGVRPIVSSRFLVPFVGLLLGLNAFANDILLPSFYGIATDFSASIERVQTLVPIFLIAAGCGQLLCGPLSDRFGRRPLLMTGFCLFVIGTLVCAQATSMAMLQVGRVVQGFGSAFLVVVGRASLRDTQSGADLARAMAMTSAIFAIGPIVAPMTGLLLTRLGGWRAVFGGTLAALVGLIGAALLGYRETHSQSDRAALDPARIRAAVARIFKNRQSRNFLLTASVLQFAIVSVVSNSPRLFKSEFGIEGVTYALMFASTAFGIVIGQLINHRLIGARGVLEATRLAASVLAATAASIALAAALDVGVPALFLVQLAIFNMAFLVVMSNSASLVLEPHRDIAGLTASVFGFFTQLTGGVLALASYRLLGSHMLPWSLTLTTATLIVYASIALRRQEVA